MIKRHNKISFVFLAALALGLAFGAGAQEGTILYSPDIDSPKITSVNANIK